MTADDPQINALRDIASNLRSQFESMVERGPDLARQAKAVTGSATSRDGLISVTVDARGQLASLDIDPRIYRRPDSEELAESILETVKQATSEAQDQVAAIFEPVVGQERIRSMLDNDSEATTSRMENRMRENGLDI